MRRLLWSISFSPIASAATTLLATWALFACNLPLSAQSNAGCASSGYRVVAQHWDSLLGVNWEVRGNCVHPEWPAHAVRVDSSLASSAPQHPATVKVETAPILKPLVIHAGDTVRLWQHDNLVHIQMVGIAEQSAHEGDRMMVRVTTQTDGGANVQRISGVVHAAGDVEMER